MKRLCFVLVSFSLLAVTVITLPRLALLVAERSAMVLKPNGPGRPEDFGVKSEVVWLVGHGRRLQASVVRAGPSCTHRTAALLLFHGRGETISMWARVQAFLSRQCVGSMVFDYSGHGSSTAPAHVWTLNQDASTAYRAFWQLFPVSNRHCVMGHSMGNAPMLSAYPVMLPIPDCVVVANAFSSLQDFARASGAPAPVAALLHGVWDNIDRLPEVHVPLLLVHSDGDKTIPADMPGRLKRAAPSSSINITMHGFTHDAVYEDPTRTWWAPILAFIMPRPESS